MAICSPSSTKEILLDLDGGSFKISITRGRLLLQVTRIGELW